MTDERAADERPWPRIDWDDLVGPEWAAWYAMTPQERCRESQMLWATFIALGGSLEPDPDPQSPFYDPDEAAQSKPSGFDASEMTRLWAASLRKRLHGG